MFVDCLEPFRYTFKMFLCHFSVNNVFKLHGNSNTCIYAFLSIVQSCPLIDDRCTTLTHWIKAILLKFMMVVNNSACMLYSSFSTIAWHMLSFSRSSSSLWYHWTCFILLYSSHRYGGECFECYYGRSIITNFNSTANYGSRYCHKGENKHLYTLLVFYVNV